MFILVVIKEIQRDTDTVSMLRNKLHFLYTVHSALSVNVRLQAITLANIVEMIFFQFLRKEQLLRELLGGLMIFL